MIEILAGIAGGFSAWNMWEAGEDAEDRADEQAALMRQTAEHNKKISLYDASVAMADAMAKQIETGQRLQIHLKNMDKVLGSIRAGYGKSGVATGEGSALDVVIESAREGAKDAEMIVYEGETAASRRRKAAKRYQMLADYGLRDAAAHASLVESAGADEARYYQFQAVGAGLETIADLGENFGWWD